MSSADRLLRSFLTFQGLFYLGINLWALTATRHFLIYTNPQSDLFEARSFAALSLVLAIFFLVGTWRKDLLRPAAFLGLGSAVAIVLVELFHLPEIGLRTMLWFDFIIQAALAAAYITLFFFRRDREAVKEEATETAVEIPVETELAEAFNPPSPTLPPVEEGSSVEDTK